MRHSIRRPFTWAFLAIGGVILAAVLAFLFGLVVMALWNWLMPEIFGIRAISYWEAWGMVLLAHILFKAGRWGDHGSTRHDRAREDEWKDRFRRRFKDRFFGSPSPEGPYTDGEPGQSGTTPSGESPEGERQGSE